MRASKVMDQECRNQRPRSGTKRLVATILSCANESELLPSGVSHLQVSAVESEPSRSFLGLLEPCAGPDQAGDLQYTNAGVELAVARQRRNRSRGSWGMAQISWQSRALRRHEVSSLKLSHPRSAAYPWLRSNGKGQILGHLIHETLVRRPLKTAHFSTTPPVIPLRSRKLA